MTHPLFVVSLPLEWSPDQPDLDAALDMVARQVQALRWERLMDRLLDGWPYPGVAVKFTYTTSSGFGCDAGMPDELYAVDHDALGIAPENIPSFNAKRANEFEADLVVPFRELGRVLLSAETFPLAWVRDVLGCDEPPSARFLTPEELESRSRRAVSALVGAERRAMALETQLPPAPKLPKSPRF